MALLRRIFSGTGWKHAAAELALIIVGVSIALWADAWVGERRDLQREKVRLTALYADTAEMLTAISTARAEASEAATALRKLVTLEPPFEPYEETSTLLRHGLLYGTRLHPEMSVYNDLKNSGELSLLTNPDLRQALSAMEAVLEQLRLAQADLTTVQQLNIDSYMVDHMDLMSFYGELTGLERASSLTGTDLSFVADREFRNRALLKLDVVMQIEIVLGDTESRVTEVKRGIEADLED